jgi:hypothetical protein
LRHFEAALVSFFAEQQLDVNTKAAPKRRSPKRRFNGNLVQ